MEALRRSVGGLESVQEAAQVGLRPEGNADADRGQEEQGSAGEEAGREAAAKVGLGPMAKGVCMIQGREIASAAFTMLAMLACLGAKADAAQCGSTAAGFETWKREFAEEARAKGASGSGIAALMQTNYATPTIAADRGQRSFGLSLDQFMAKRGASAIVARGRALK